MSILHLSNAGGKTRGPLIGIHKSMPSRIHLPMSQTESLIWRVVGGPLYNSKVRVHETYCIVV